MPGRLFAKVDEEDSSEPPRKRVKREPSPVATLNSVAGGGYSTRAIGANALPSLTTVALKRFTKEFLDQTSREKFEITKTTLQFLPEHLMLRAWSHLVDAWPERMTSDFIADVFLRGTTVKIPGTLPGFNKKTMKRVSGMGNALRHLEITGHNIPDAIFASTLSALPMLEHLNLRDCRMVASLSCRAVERTHDHLTYLNLGGTNATFSDVKPIVIRLQSLEILKLSGLEGLSDLSLGRLMDDIYDEAEPLSAPLLKLRSLKLRHTPLTMASLSRFLTHLELLEKLDISFMPLGPLLSQIKFPPKLTKVSFTSTPIDANQLTPLLSNLKELRTLNIGALGESAKTASGFAIGGKATGPSGSRTLTDAVLINMTDVLSTLPHLEQVMLAGNNLLGVGATRGVQYFIGQVGRKLKTLNLSGINRLRSDDLEGLLPEDGEEPSRLERLMLMGCNVNDQAGVYISSCPRLNFLDLENTKFSEEGLFSIIDACTQLETINLTSCRGVNRSDRRRFFEVWRAAKRDA
ncbi:RNI-like protein [Serendipita vermifera]|nr:RNI-like protein [Serendipita vermifera]